VVSKPDSSFRLKARVVPKVTPVSVQPYSLQAAKQNASTQSGTSAGLAHGVGDRVRHMKYGEGTVAEINPGTKDYQVTVDFDNVGRKIMYAGFAKLQLV